MGKIFTFLLASLDKEALPKRINSWRKDFAQMGAKSVLKELIPIENGATMENSRFAFLETVSLHSSLQSNRQADFCLSGIHL